MNTKYVQGVSNTFFEEDIFWTSRFHPKPYFCELKSHLDAKNSTQTFNCTLRPYGLTNKLESNILYKHKILEHREDENVKISMEITGLF